MEESKSLQTISKARQMLAEAKTLDDVLMIRDKAEAVRVYAAAAKLGLESQNEAAEIKIRAERKAGELLREMPKNEGAKGKIQEHLTGGNIMLPPDEQPTLAELGVEKMQSHRWQTMAELPEEEFEEFVAETKENKEELTSTAIYREAKKKEREENIQKQVEDIQQNKFVPPTNLYDVVVIDPPWPYGTKYDPLTRRAANPYPEMSLEEIAAIKLPANDDCVLWLWTTHKFMRYSFALLDNWGFRDVAIVTWVKNRMGLGSWLRSQSEFCIMAVKGHPTIELTNQTTVITGDMREHSRKPDEFYEMVDKLCIGYKIDYFSRESREGWAQYGNEVEKFT